MSTHPIDIVIPWVDGSDPVWQADHAKYRASKSADNHPARYREWGLFRYWFRGIEQNAPWVRKVHLLTYGHLPAWLEPDHPKLHIVNHRDFIPEEYLPTFSSHTIELNMHRIPDLAEHFLYFNDDVYLMKPSRPEDFFRDGLPCDTAVMGVIKNNDTANFMPYIMLNMMALVNMSFDKRSVIRQNFGKWFYPGYGKGLLYNLYLLPWGDFTGFRNYHSCVSFCKSTLEEVWDRFPGGAGRHLPPQVPGPGGREPVPVPVLAAGQRPVCPQKARQHLSHHRQAERVGGGAAAAGREVPGGLRQRRPHGLRFRYGAAAAGGYLPADLPADFRL